MPGQRVLDLGTGTGTVARGLAQQGCQVIGLDPSAPLLAQARQLDRHAGVAVDHIIATVERIGLASGNLEMVTGPRQPGKSAVSWCLAAGCLSPILTGFHCRVTSSRLPNN